MSVTQNGVTASQVERNDSTTSSGSGMDTPDNQVIKFTLLGLKSLMDKAGNSKGGSITVPLTSCLTGLESAVSQLTIFAFIFKAG
jgi:hypothetical protein